MRVWTIIPVKSLVCAKSRLAFLLDDPSRRGLCLVMLRRVVGAVKASSAPLCLVTTPDPDVISWCRREGLVPFQDGERDLNSSLKEATFRALELGAEAVLIIPSDVPLVTKEDIDGMVELGFHSSVVISPCRREEGTNALFIRPPGALSYSFGPGSFQRHLRLARSLGLKVEVYRSATLGLDVDLPEDLKDFLGASG